MVSKKQIFYWALFDFANTFAMIVFFLYFTEWLVIEHHVSDLAYNLIFVFASLLLLLTAPLASIIADKWKTRMVFLKPATILSFLSYIVCGIIANFFPSMVLFAVIMYFFANYFYQLVYTFYNPILHDISISENRGRISGIGMTASWLGQIAGVIVALPLAGLAHPLFGIGIAGRAQTFFPAAIIFILCALPMLLFHEEKEPRADAQVSVPEEIRNLGASVKKLWLLPGVALFLGSYFFFNDAIVTAANNFPIYLQKVFGVSDDVKSYTLLAILVTSAIGAYVAGVVADRIGLKKTLRGILIGWIIIMPILGYQTYFPYFAGAVTVMGFLYGGIFTVARAVMTELTPAKDLNFAFSFYSLMERCSTLVGPLGWGLSLYFLASYGKDAYRYSFLTLTVFVVIGLACVWKMPDPARGPA